MTMSTAEKPKLSYPSADTFLGEVLHQNEEQLAEQLAVGDRQPAEFEEADASGFSSIFYSSALYFISTSNIMNKL